MKRGRTMLTRRGQARRSRITTTTRKRIAPLPPPLPPLCCYRCRHRMPPHQLRHYCLCSSSGSSGSSSSGLRRCAVAAAADSRMPSLTPVFFVLLTECSLHVAQNTPCRGSFPPEFRIQNSGSKIPEQINLSLESFNSDVCSAEFQKFHGLSGIPENVDRQEPEFGLECTT